MERRSVLAGLAALLTAGCSKIGDSKAFGGLVDGAEKLHRGAHRLIGGRQSARSVHFIVAWALFAFVLLHLVLLLLNRPLRNTLDMVTGGRGDEAA